MFYRFTVLLYGSTCLVALYQGYLGYHFDTFIADRCRPTTCQDLNKSELGRETGRKTPFWNSKKDIFTTSPWIFQILETGNLKLLKFFEKKSLQQPAGHDEKWDPHSSVKGDVLGDCKPPWRPVRRRCVGFWATDLFHIGTILIDTCHKRNTVTGKRNWSSLLSVCLTFFQPLAVGRGTSSQSSERRARASRRMACDSQGALCSMEQPLVEIFCCRKQPFKLGKYRIYQSCRS